MEPNGDIVQPIKLEAPTIRALKEMRPATTTAINSSKLSDWVTGVAILLDSAPRNWASVEEVNGRPCRALSQQGIRVVLVYAAPLPLKLDKHMREAGAVIEVVPYNGKAVIVTVGNDHNVSSFRAFRLSVREQICVE